MAKGEDITTKYKLDVSEFKKGITEANNQMKLATAQFKAASAGMDNWTKSSEGISAKLKQLHTILDAQNSKLQNYAKQLNAAKTAEKDAAQNVAQLKQALEQAKKSYGNNSDEVKKLKSELLSAEKAEASMKQQVSNLSVTMENQRGKIEGTQKEMKNLEGSLKEVEKAEKIAAVTGKTVEETLEQMHSSSRKAVDGFSVMEGALASLVADGIKKAIDAFKNFAAESFQVGSNFQAAMSQVQAVSGASATDMETLTRLAEKMGATTKFSATEAADALNYMAMAGWKTEDMVGGLPGILNLAAASGADLATTSDIVTDALTAMGYGAKDAGRLADVMAAASSNANTNVEMMGQTFKYAAPLVGALGYNMEDTALAIGLMANSGIKADQAGTALRSILTRLAKPPKEAAAAMDGLGVSITNTDGSMKSFREIIVDLRDKFAGLDEVEQASYAASIAGQEAMSGLLSIVNAAPADFDKLTVAVDNSSGSAEKMSKIMQDNVAGDLTTLSSKIESVQITLYKKLEPTIRKVIQAFQKWANSVDWNAVGKKIEGAIGGVVKVFEWFVKNRNLVSSAVKAMLAAFVVSKILSFTQAITSSTTALGAAKLASTLFAGVTKSTTAAQVAQTIATNAGTVATKLFNAAWAANPLGVVVIAVAALAAGIYGLVKVMQDSNKYTDANTEATRKLREEHDELINTLNDSSQARKDAIASTQEEVGAADVLMNKLIELDGIENKNAYQKQQMKQIVEELNSIMPELNLAYDEEKDALNMSTDAIKANVEAQKELAMAKAAQEQLTQVAKEMVSIELEQGKILEQNKANEEAYLLAKQRVAAFERLYGADRLNMTVAQVTKYNELKKAEEERRKALEDTNKMYAESTNRLEDLNNEFNRTSELSSKLYSDAEINKRIATLTDLVEAQGRKIPEALAQGMKDGQYAVPQSIAELDKLMEFDDAVKKAGLSGEKIPTSISQGMMSGKVSVEDAIQQINDVVSFNKALEEAQGQGYAIPEKLSESMLSGAITVEEANKQLQDSLTFDEMVNKANLAGTELIDGLSEQIRNGAIKPQEAIKQLNQLTSFDELVQKATDAGIKVPDSVREGILNGQTKPSEAVAIMNALISYQEALENSKAAGAEIPEYFSQSILSGQTSIENANAAMNRLIEFQEAIAEANLSGQKIPNELAEKIARGETTVASAIEQLNGAAQNKASSLPELLGKYGAEAGMKVANELAAQKAEANTAGANLVAGAEEGINNRKGSIFATVTNLASSILSKFKAGLQEHSPSAATNEMGQFLIQGLELGIDKEEGIVTKQIDKLAGKLLDGFNNSLDPSNLDGAEIPGTLAEDLLAGENAVNAAATDMTTAVTEVTDQLAPDLNTSGKEAGLEWQTGIYVGMNDSGRRSAINRSITAVGNGIVSSLSSSIPASKSATIAGYFLDGIAQGLNNSGKLSYIYTLVRNIGNQMIANLQSSLQVHSPSKATEQIAKYYVDGIGVGLDKNADSVVEQASSIGDSMLGALASAMKDGGQKTLKTLPLVNDFVNSCRSGLLQLAESMSSKKNALIEAARTLAENIASTISEYLKHNNPLAVLSSELNATGLVDSLRNTTLNLQSSLQAMNLGMSAVTPGRIGEQAVVQSAPITNNHFTQNIYAPKQPSRAELYRQTKNLLNMAGNK